MEKRAPLTEAETDRIIELREAGKTEGFIAREIGCSEGTVSWALLKAGVDIYADRALPPVPEHPTTCVRGGHLVRRYTQAEDERLLALEATGLNVHRIAVTLGRRHNSVVGRLRSLARRQARAEVQA